MSTVQKYLLGLIALSALYIVAAPDSHIASALGAGQSFVSGTLRTAQGR